MDELERIKKIIAEKVTGRIEPAHDALGHHYRFTQTGTIVDSVTTQIIVEKPHLRRWAAKAAVEKFIEIMYARGWDSYSTIDKDMIQSCVLAHEYQRDAAGATGTKAHEVLEIWENEWIKTGAMPTEEDIIRMVKTAYGEDCDYRVIAAARSGVALFEKYSYIPVAPELLVGWEPWGMAGTLDLLVVDEKSNIILLDHKTSNAIDDTYAMQVASYKRMFEKMTGLKIKKCVIAKLDKFSNKFKIYNIPDSAKAFNAQQANNKVYKWLKNGKDKLVEDKKIITL